MAYNHPQNSSYSKLFISSFPPEIFFTLIHFSQSSQPFQAPKIAWYVILAASLYFSFLSIWGSSASFNTTFSVFSTILSLPLHHKFCWIHTTASFNCLAHYTAINSATVDRLWALTPSGFKLHFNQNHWYCQAAPYSSLTVDSTLVDISSTVTLAWSWFPVSCFLILVRDLPCNFWELYLLVLPPISSVK